MTAQTAAARSPNSLAARDIAHVLGTVGHVSYLRRTRAGPFGLESAISLDFLNELAKARDLQRRAQWRLDFIYAENSMGFHASQEAARILAEAIDFSRQGQLEAREAAPRPAGNR